MPGRESHPLKAPDLSWRTKCEFYANCPKSLDASHWAINEEIERNKEAFSDEIKQTLYRFKKNLEQNVSEEIEKKMSKLLDKHFFDISSKVTSSFYESASPVLKRAEEDMQRLHNDVC